MNEHRNVRVEKKYIRSAIDRPNINTINKTGKTKYKIKPYYFDGKIVFDCGGLLIDFEPMSQECLDKWMAYTTLENKGKQARSTHGVAMTYVMASHIYNGVKEHTKGQMKVVYKVPDLYNDCVDELYSELACVKGKQYADDICEPYEVNPKLIPGLEPNGKPDRDYIKEIEKNKQLIRHLEADKEGLKKKIDDLDTEHKITTRKLKAKLDEYESTISKLELTVEVNDASTEKMRRDLEEGKRTIENLTAELSIVDTMKSHLRDGNTDRLLTNVDRFVEKMSNTQGEEFEVMEVLNLMGYVNKMVNEMSNVFKELEEMRQKVLSSETVQNNVQARKSKLINNIRRRTTTKSLHCMIMDEFADIWPDTVERGGWDMNIDLYTYLKSVKFNFKDLEDPMKALEVAEEYGDIVLTHSVLKRLDVRVKTNKVDTVIQNAVINPPFNPRSRPALSETPKSTMPIELARMINLAVRRSDITVDLPVDIADDIEM